VHETLHKEPSDLKQEVQIRRLAYSDLPAVISIERRSFPSPWSLAMFVLELSKPSGICLAATEGDELLGYLVCSRYDQVWHLMNVAVAPERRRSGVARGLIARLLEEGEGRLPFTLEVRVSNRPAIAMYEQLGFRAAGVRPRYYRDNGEDVVAVIRQLGLTRVNLVGHSYGGAIALVAAADKSIAGRLSAVNAITPYLQDLPSRALMEYEDEFDDEAFEEAYDSIGHGKRQEMLDYVQTTRGGRARAAVSGLPRNLIADPPAIPKHVKVRILNGRANSMLPDDLISSWREYFNMDQQFGAPTRMVDVDEMGTEFANALKGRGHPNVWSLDGRGSHMWPGEYPDEFVERVTSGH